MDVLHLIFPFFSVFLSDFNQKDRIERVFP